DAKGNVAVYTGPKAPNWSRHVKRAMFSVQGNILVGPQVVEEMARAFENAKGELAERLLAAVKAGDEARGDRRGRQSASILVVRKGGGAGIANDRLVYINIDDHKDPIYELARELPLQLEWSYYDKVESFIAQGKLGEAYDVAEKLSGYAVEN